MTLCQEVHARRRVPHTMEIAQYLAADMERSGTNFSE
jgi:hypothetical protein